jgi:dynein heavy chain
MRYIPFFFCVKMKDAIIAELTAANLQNIPHTMTKIIQLYETKNSRHSTMIVGQTLSGKTVSWKILQAAMTRLNRDGDAAFQAVRVGRLDALL